MSPRTLLKLLIESFKAWHSDNASRLAAALAYYTIFSLSPLLIMAIAIAGSLFGEDTAKGEIVGEFIEIGYESNCTENHAKVESFVM